MEGIIKEIGGHGIRYGAYGAWGDNKAPQKLMMNEPDVVALPQEEAIFTRNHVSTNGRLFPKRDK